jgi:uncharacterized spore protein YtfJ
MAKAPTRRPLDRLVDRVTGAKLCFGEPVQVGATSVIPVSRVRFYGGGGWGSGGGADGGEGDGGGAGGYLDAQPLGFIELRSDGSRYQEISDPERAQRMLKAGAGAAATLLAASAGARRLRGGGRSARLLGR